MVVADISEESANETLGSLSSDLRGQGHMAAVVDVSSKESVKKLVTSIQVCGTDGEDNPEHTHVSFKVIMCNITTYNINTNFFLFGLSDKVLHELFNVFFFSPFSVLTVYVLLSLCRPVTSSLPQCV